MLAQHLVTRKGTGIFGYSNTPVISTFDPGFGRWVIFF